ncbi:MAG TPA: ATP-binding protein [Terriglobia bacterium]|jgi:signal transduction histidine kinase|nr:ATP-binding protein [Terriglobia bacterium]
MRAPRLGLRAKILTIISLAVVSAVGVSTYIAMLLTRQLVEEEVYSKALAQARSTAHNLVNEGALQNPDRLPRLLQQIERDLPGVKQSDVFFHRPGRRLVASSAPQDEHEELDNRPGIENYFEFERPEEDQITIETPRGKFWIMSTTIRDQGIPVGCLVLKVSKSQTSRVTRALVLRNLLLMLGSLAFIMIVVQILFTRSVQRPASEMVKVMEAAERGELHVRARVKSRDEIGLLAAHLNRMLHRIDNFSSELERRVDDATAELARRNEELKRINEELFETQKTLARAERLAVAGQLAASLAHEIGTPLNSISGHVQLLARRKNWDEGSERRLQIIEKQIENIVRTVRNLLSWTRKFDLKIGPIDLRQHLQDAVLLSSPALQNRKIRVQTTLARNCPQIYGDPGCLQQVFLNLINNSMDAMPQGGELRIGLRFPAPGDAQSVAIEFEDTGSGIPLETLEHIFEPMFTTKQIGTGAGLGLAICDQIVRQHGGTIAVESELARGTRFTITLPVDCREKQEAVPAFSSAASASTTRV